MDTSDDIHDLHPLGRRALGSLTHSLTHARTHSPTGDEQICLESPPPPSPPCAYEMVGGYVVHPNSDKAVGGGNLQSFEFSDGGLGSSQCISACESNHYCYGFRVQAIAGAGSINKCNLFGYFARPVACVASGQRHLYLKESISASGSCGSAVSSCYTTDPSPPPLPPPRPPPPLPPAGAAICPSDSGCCDGKADFLPDESQVDISSTGGGEWTMGSGLRWAKYAFKDDTQCMHSPVCMHSVR